MKFFTLSAVTVLGFMTSVGLAAGPDAGVRQYCFSYKVVGTGKPVILIPGLTCTGDVWDGTVAELKGRYQCYVLTLPGFGKQPPITGPYVSHVRDDIIAFVKDKRLDHPSVIGHSLGGFMTYELGIAEPKMWGHLIAVDGLPFLSVLYNPNATAANMKTFAASVADRMGTAKPDDFRTQLKATLVSQITDPKEVDRINEFCKDSSQAETAQVIQEMMTTDLRGQVNKIQAPFLLIGAGQFATTDAVKKMLVATYRDEVASIPGVSLEMNWKSRHFVMLDDPAGFYKSIEDFLESADSKGSH